MDEQLKIFDLIASKNSQNIQLAWEIIKGALDQEESPNYYTEIYIIRRLYQLEAIYLLIYQTLIPLLSTEEREWVRLPYAMNHEFEPSTQQIKNFSKGNEKHSVKNLLIKLFFPNFGLSNWNYIHHQGQLDFFPYRAVKEGYLDVRKMCYFLELCFHQHQKFYTYHIKTILEFGNTEQQERFFEYIYEYTHKNTPKFPDLLILLAQSEKQIHVNLAIYRSYHFLQSIKKNNQPLLNMILEKGTAEHFRKAIRKRLDKGHLFFPNIRLIRYPQVLEEFADKLQSLEISLAKGQSLPKSIFEFPQLLSLQSKSPLPKQLDKASNLQKLTLEDVTEPSDIFGQLPHLNTINFVNVSEVKLPPSFRKLKKIQKISSSVELDPEQIPNDLIPYTRTSRTSRYQVYIYRKIHSKNMDV
ncbi:MAG: hypothetical protein MK212_10800 [Saprospiraceae bacterium]|nr:hypothetical protein [Saprospiraceae bacterium]